MGGTPIVNFELAPPTGPLPISDGTPLVSEVKVVVSRRISRIMTIDLPGNV